MPKPCDCPYPVCVRVADIVISDKIMNSKGKGTVLIKRYCDCIMHGPFAVHIEVRARHNEHGTLIRRELDSPVHKQRGREGVNITNRLRGLA